MIPTGHPLFLGLLPYQNDTDNNTHASPERVQDSKQKGLHLTNDSFPPDIKDIKQIEGTPALRWTVTATHCQKPAAIVLTFRREVKC